MRETTFLKQNEKKWKEFESMLRAKKGAVSPDDFADLFIEITDDLSYAKTHYPGSNTVNYLNGLAGQVHLSLVKNKKEKKNSFFAFWKYDLPLTMADTLPKLSYAFIIFMVSIAIGVVSTLNDSAFPRLILGDEYVDMTIRNIQAGEPLAVYSFGGEMDMFFAITFNNILVSFITFMAGFFLSVGTAYYLFTNGVMVGSFLTFMGINSFFGDSMLIVFVHGTLELSAIVIAGAAGFHLGNSILFPRTLSRGQSLRIGAVKGLKIMLGLIPVFCVAGLLEGFVTRHTEMPAIFNLGIIALSLVFIVYYFIVYPLKLKGTGLTQEDLENGNYRSY